MNVVYRHAAPSDAQGIAEVYLASRKTFLPFAPLAHSETGVRQWIAEVFIPSGNVTVAVAFNEPIGMMAFSRDESFDWIDQLYLHPWAVGRGIRTHFLERAKQELGPVIRLYTLQANTSSRRFYERHGFQAVAFNDGRATKSSVPMSCMNLTVTISEEQT